MKERDNGFTLVELMIAISIISILITAAYPSSRQMYKRYQLSSGTQSIHSILTNARMQAVEQTEIVSVSFDAANRTYIAFIDNGASAGNAGDGVLQTADGEIVINGGSLPGDVAFESAAFAGNLGDGSGFVTQFNSRGFPVLMSGGTPTFFTGQLVLRIPVDDVSFFYSRVTMGAGGDLTLDKSVDNVTYYN